MRILQKLYARFHVCNMRSKKFNNYCSLCNKSFSWGDCLELKSRNNERCFVQSSDANANLRRGNRHFSAEEEMKFIRTPKKKLRKNINRTPTWHVIKYEHAEGNVTTCNDVKEKVIWRRSSKYG